jgi:hypothetical protein
MYREIGVHHLHRHRAIKRGVTCEEDDAHPAMPQLGLEPILRPEGRLEAGGKLVRTGHGILPMNRLGPGYRPIVASAVGTASCNPRSRYGRGDRAANPSRH